MSGPSCVRRWWDSPETRNLWSSCLWRQIVSWQQKFSLVILLIVSVSCFFVLRAFPSIRGCRNVAILFEFVVWWVSFQWATVLWIDSSWFMSSSWLEFWSAQTVDFLVYSGRSMIHTYIPYYSIHAHLLWGKWRDEASTSNHIRTLARAIAFLVPFKTSKRWERRLLSAHTSLR